MIQLFELMQDKSYPESGKVLYGILEEALNNDSNVDIDMTNVISLPSMFLNASFGNAFVVFGKEAIKKHTRFFHIGKSQAERLNEYFLRYQ